MTVLASQNTGFYLGLLLSFVAVTAVVALVAVILTLASRIANQARVAGEALEHVRENTDVLRAIGQTNQHALAILDGARTARGALTG
ncbi:MAG: hypothetical protein ACYC91_04155 [Solirubrobacteraceae bacterium]